MPAACWTSIAPFWKPEPHEAFACYELPLVFAACDLFVLLLRRLAPCRAQAFAGALLMAGAMGLCAGHRLRMAASYPWQRDVFLSQPRVERLVPAQARIGCFDAGIPAYFSARTVVNLDGLVNHAAVSYWKSRTLDRYLAAQRIQYIANEPGTLHHALRFMQSPPVLVPVAQFPLRGWATGARVLWRVGHQPLFRPLEAPPAGRE